MDTQRRGPEIRNPKSEIQNPLDWSVLLIGAVGIAYQILLMRVFSIAQWHHFAYMIISIAMLGFGASGTVLALLRPRLEGREAAGLRATACALPIGLIACYVLSQKIPFETFQLVSQPRQIGYLLVLYVILALPFFLVSTCIAFTFFLNPGHIGRLYFFNMVGSGLGAAATVGLLYLAHPSKLICLLAVPAALAHLLLVRGRLRRGLPSQANTPLKWGMLRGYGLLVLLAAWLAWGPGEPVRVSEYKGLSYALRFPDAETIGERCSPLSVVTAVKSAQIRETPGQIANYPMSELGPLPAQVGLYFDGGAVSPVNEFKDGDLDRFAYLDYVTGAAAYRLVDRPRVLVLGAGGGTDVLSALAHGARHVTAVEVDPNVLGIMNGTLGAFSGRLYHRPDVTAVLAEGRGYLQSHRDLFDLIHLPLFGSFTAAAAGVYALNESYLYTVDAVLLYLNRLSAQGVLAINCWLKTPPRDAIKLFATAAEACRRLGLDNPGGHLAFLRSWNNATILVTRAPLTPAQVAALRDFCTARGLDLCHLPGLRQDETNKYMVLETPVYFQAAQALLSPQGNRFYDDFVFYVRPATDDRPYFFRFFKWAALGRLLRGMGTQWAPFVEWGYLALVATLLQAVLVSIVLILLPLVAFARRQHGQGARRWVLVYFATLGLAYMFLEIAFIQRFMLFLAYPVYAVAVVLTAFLVFSGLGSLFAERWQAHVPASVGWAVAGTAMLGAVLLASLQFLFQVCAGWPDSAKIALSVALLAPMAFCMGIPFPSGLQFVSDRHAALVPWAWGVNGCASVVGATLATFTAVHVGFRSVVVLALVAYGIATVALRRLCAQGQVPGPAS